MNDDKKIKEIILDWPAKVLSPNARVHWAVKAKAAKLYRKQAFLICRNENIVIPESINKLHVFIDFYPPDKRNRDADNLLSSLKNALDGIAEAIGVNDRRFICHPYLKDKIEKGGLVKIRVTFINEVLLSGL